MRRNGVQVMESMTLDDLEGLPGRESGWQADMNRKLDAFLASHGSNRRPLVPSFGGPKPDATPRNGVEHTETQEGPMPPGVYERKKKPCPNGCGVMIFPNNLYHLRSCPKRPGASAESPAPQPQAPRAAKKAQTPARHARKPVKRTATLAAPPLQPATGGHCEREACPYRGLSSHLAKVRVQELVRAGLGIEAAARFVREQCG